VSRILQSEGILHVRRGHIHIRDLAALERKACDCYRTTCALTAGQIGGGENARKFEAGGLASPPSTRIERV
jgi:hypothetical protein